MESVFNLSCPDTDFGAQDCARILQSWSTYSDLRLAGCFFRMKRFADPYDASEQKSSLHVMLPVPNEPLMLNVAYLSASNPSRERQLPSVLKAKSIRWMIKDCFVNVTQTLIPTESLIRRLECLRCKIRMGDVGDGPRCSSLNPCTYLSFQPNLIKTVLDFRTHPDFAHERPRRMTERLAACALAE